MSDPKNVPRKELSHKSSTSFYTDVERQDSYESLEAVLNAQCRDGKVRQVIRDLLDACASITEALRAALVHVEGGTNDFGDTQLSVDVSRTLVVTESRSL